MGQFVLMNIDMTLDDDSIQKAIDTIIDLKEKLAYGLSELARMLTEERGVRIAQMYIGQFPAVDTGALHDSITGTYNDGAHEGVIYTDVYYAAYVEYGTGIVGEENPHPSSNSWTYDIHSHGESGWWYPSEKGWIQAKDGGPMLAWTKGMPSRPFMYYTLRELEEEAEREGGRIIAKYIP